MDGSLAGLVVVAVEQAVAAPFCTARLPDAGARVIKIERPAGDVARFYDITFPKLNDMSALSVHPYLKRIEVAMEAGIVRMPAPAVSVNDVSRQCGKVPVIGEQTDHVLAEFCESVRAS